MNCVFVESRYPHITVASVHKQQRLKLNLLASIKHSNKKTTATKTTQRTLQANRMSPQTQFFNESFCKLYMWSWWNARTYSTVIVSWRKHSGHKVASPTGRDMKMGTLEELIKEIEWKFELLHFTHKESPITIRKGKLSQMKRKSPR